MEKGSIRALARKVFAATRRSISPYDICLAYCKDHGWHVVLMGDGGHGDKVLELLGLSEYARGKRAFCYRGLTTQIIAVDSSLPHRQRAFCIAHELGHIMLDHVTQNDTVLERMEAEANYFALQLLAPLAVLDAMDAKSASEIQALCGLSHQAAELRRRDFERRNRHKAKHGDTKHDLLFLQQFAIVSQDPVI